MKILFYDFVPYIYTKIKEYQRKNFSHLFCLEHSVCVCVRVCLCVCMTSSLVSNLVSICEFLYEITF